MEAEYNDIMMSFILWTPHQTLLGRSNQEGRNRHSTWHEQDRRKIHTKSWSKTWWKEPLERCTHRWNGIKWIL